MATQADTDRQPGSPDPELRRPPPPGDDRHPPAPEPEKEPAPGPPEPKKARVEEKPSDDGGGKNDDKEDSDKGEGTDKPGDKDSPPAQTVSTTDKNDEFGDKGSEGKYWEVDLVRPPGASEALISYLAMAEAAIQTAVDLLGRGMPTPPPEVGDLLSKVTRETLGKGKAEEAYQDTLTKVDAKQTSLLVMDNQVIDTSIVMAAEQDRTLKTIIDIVERLNGVLTKVGSAKLKPPMEMQLLELTATAVDLVYDKVIAVSDLSSEMAGDGGEGSGGNGKPSTGGGGAGGAAGGAGAAGAMGGLGSMLPMLAMLPMSLMPLATQLLPELLDPEKKEGEEGEQSATDEAAPEPIDPTAPPDGATAPNDHPAPAGPNGNEQAPQEASPQAQA
ncbi:hypothetical protein [Nocardia carnea]|uniref:hypothetical protein n=1 Tax=Nocardia carnea TaxID=37328 RepID=UPI002457039B|nr:hypothetical protein [Nocardia carnea]